jgi:hypothetical protein
VCVAVAMLVAGPAVAEAAVPNPFYGIVDTHYPTQLELERAATAGAGILRVQFDWRFAEPRPGVRDIRGGDPLVASAARAGITLLPDLLGVPKWMSRDRSRPPIFTAAQRNAWRTLLTEYARRWGSNGTFWAEHPEIPKRPITTWEIWNEPNLGNSIGGKASPRRFVRLLKISSAGLKAGDPAAQVLTGGLFPYHTLRNTTKLSKYLKAMYRVPGAADAFDALGIHPYAPRPAGVLRWVQVTRRIMRKNGDGATPIWVSGFGWPTAGAGFRTSVVRATLRQQARWLTETYSLFSQNRNSLGIASALWFSYTNTRRKGPDALTERAGLFRSNGSPKPSWFAFARVAGGTP